MLTLFFFSFFPFFFSFFSLFLFFFYSFFLEREGLEKRGRGVGGILCEYEVPRPVLLPSLQAFCRILFEWGLVLVERLCMAQINPTGCKHVMFTCGVEPTSRVLLYT